MTCRSHSEASELARLKAWKFDARTEAMNAEQRRLFEETMAEDEASLQAQLEQLQSKSPAKQAQEEGDKPPRKPHRQKLPEHLRRVDHTHEPWTCGIKPVQVFIRTPGRADCFGGDILSTKTSAGTHFYNGIDGVKWDLTASQFLEPIPYDDALSSREMALADTSTEKYTLIKERLASEL
jgi:hypothetical protein